MSIRENVNIDQVIDFLNNALKYDKQCVEKLCNNRVECNEKMADHPTIQVHCYNNESPSVGLIGILNGLFGIDEYGWGRIAAIKDMETGEIYKFERITNEDINKSKRDDDNE